MITTSRRSIKIPLVGSDANAWTEVINPERTRKVPIIDKIKPRNNKKKYESLIYYVKDRPGHDLRYSLNSKKIFKKIKWNPKIKLDKGLEFTIKWYLKNSDWWMSIRKFKYKGERLGTNKWIKLKE